MSGGVVVQFLGAVGVVVAVGLGCAAAPVQLAQATPDAATLFREGQALYVSRCAMCHGLHGEGDYGPRIEASTVVADTQQLIMQMFVGTEDGMSPQFYRELSDREIAATATFVRGALGNSFGPVFPNEVAGLR